MYHLDELAKAFQGEIRLSEPLAHYSSLKLGGPADVFLLPKSRNDVVEAVRWINKYRYQHYILGYGTNVLISDSGFRGVVVRIADQLTDIRFEGKEVYAEAGASLPLLVLETLKQGLAGLESLGGVPGTVGGALLMNAGAYGSEIFDVVKTVDVVRGTRLMTLKREEVRFEYRKTNLDHDFILGTLLVLKQGDREALMERRKELLKKRRDTQPLELPNAGSIFKNPPGQYAGQLIESCGLKGYRIGGVSVSEKHANFLVNDQSGTAEDLIRLIEYVTRIVYEKHGIRLEMEVKKIGFDQ
ncbi:MAG: UDP-N-acetylmuramate dehydrogenase [Bacteroidetes bacterium]|nr:UDP-N-acetylmuramate dehydrogenase [Bacteroidota bacterium]